MPKIVGHTPPWLSRPSPGASIFADPSTPSPPSPSKRWDDSPSDTSGYLGPKRLIAHRGTEIFTAVGNQIRWADLATVKDDWEENNHKKQRTNNNPSYRTLSTAVYYQIRQLVISPSGHFLAIATEHTVHVAFLPDYARLADHSAGLLKLTCRQLGPTTHVIPESPLSSVVWHPLAAATPSHDCLITLTSEAAVRVWELDKSNKWSFERPALAIDLRKLANGVSCDQDFEPSGFGKNRGFSADDFDMEAAAACFGGQGADDEDAWAAMTFWTAMRNGDIYALCPLLPSRWCPTSTTIPSLSTSAVSRMATIAGEDADADERRAADQQYEWVQEIDQEEILDENHDIRVRPLNPSAIPRLQGPFEISSDEDENDIDVTDLTVFPARLDEAEIYSGEDDYIHDDRHGVPFTTIMVACSDGAIDIALDLEGVTGQWLPKRGRNTFSLPMPEVRELDLVTSLTLDMASANAAYLGFTPDPAHRCSTFITASSQISSLSLDEWITRIARELTTGGDVDTGLKTRLDISTASQIASLHEVISCNKSNELSAPVIVDDIDLGCLLLTSTPTSALAAIFDRQSTHSSDAATLAQSQMQLMRISSDEPPQPSNLPSRQIYAPPQPFYKPGEGSIYSVRSNLPPQQKRIIVDQPMRLSPAMLDVMTATHRAVSRQTAELETAASELFRRCDRLREEMGDQVKQMCELADRLRHLQAPDGDDARPGETTKKTPDERLDAAKTKQADLVTRYEALRRKVGRVGTARKELSAKEVAWKEEIESLSTNAGVEIEGDENKDDGIERSTQAANLNQRFEMVTSLKVLHMLSLADHNAQAEVLKRNLVETSKTLETSSPELTKSVVGSGGLQRSDSTASNRSTRSALGVSSRYQRERVKEAMGMVEREGAIIDAVIGRLEGLKLQI